MIIINKENLELIDRGELCLHDLLISSFIYNYSEQLLTIRISDYSQDKMTIEFNDVYKIYYNAPHIMNTINDNMLFGWECISPNDSFFNGIERGDSDKENGYEDLFAVRFLLSNLDELKVACKSILITLNQG